MKRKNIEIIFGEMIYVRKYDPFKDKFVCIATVDKLLAEVEDKAGNGYLVFKSKEEYVVFKENNKKIEKMDIKPAFLLSGQDSYLMELPINGEESIFIHKGPNKHSPFVAKHADYTVKNNTVKFKNFSRFDSYFWLHKYDVRYEANNF